MIKFFMKMIKMLISYGVSNILVVFDGIPLPSKSMTAVDRQAAREKNLELAVEAELLGDSRTANKYYQRSVSITPDMVKTTIAELESNGVKFMVTA